MVETPLLKVSDLRFAYGARAGSVAALEGVSFALAAGERVALLGANGAGKSTLLLAVMGLLKGARGEVRIGGEKLGRSNARALRARLGLLFQDPDDQLFSLSVFEDVAFGPRNLGLEEEAVRERVESALAACGVLDLMERNPIQMSVGQKKRVALAGVLAMRPDLLLLDEPGAALDPRGKRELVATLSGLAQAQMIVTHDLALAEKLCSRALVLADGALVYDGGLPELLARGDQLEAWGLA